MLIIREADVADANLNVDIKLNNDSTMQGEPSDEVNNVIHQADRQSRQEQLDMIIKCGLERMDEGRTKYRIFGHEFVLRDQITQAAELVQWAKDWTGDAVKASPEASVAWAGICVILPLLMNPKTADKASHDGFAYAQLECATTLLLGLCCCDPIRTLLILKFRIT